MRFDLKGGNVALAEHLILRVFRNCNAGDNDSQGNSTAGVAATLSRDDAVVIVAHVRWMNSRDRQRWSCAASDASTILERNSIPIPLVRTGKGVSNDGKRRWFRNAGFNRDWLLEYLWWCHNR